MCSIAMRVAAAKEPVKGFFAGVGRRPAGGRRQTPRRRLAAVGHRPEGAGKTAGLPRVQTTVSNAGFSGQGLTRNLAPGADDGTRKRQRVTGNLERNAELPAEAAQAGQQ